MRFLDLEVMGSVRLSALRRSFARGCVDRSESLMSISSSELEVSEADALDVRRFFFGRASEACVAHSGLG